MARSDIRDMKIFVLHDADINGYNIARTLGEATRRMPNHSVDVIDLGLTVPQAIEFGLETEKFTRRKELPADLELDEDALEWFTGEPIRAGYGKYHYECRRCELNAFSSDGLAEFIETGLQRHGATTKLVPPADVLARMCRRSATRRSPIWLCGNSWAWSTSMLWCANWSPTIRIWPTSMKPASATRSPTTRPSHGGRRRNSLWPRTSTPQMASPMLSAHSSQNNWPRR